MKSLTEYLTEGEAPKIEVGTIFIAHDYYNDFTDWYRVTKKSGASTVYLEKLPTKNISGGGYVHNGERVPDLEGEATPMTKSRRVRPNGTIRINQYVDAKVWDGKTAGRYNYDN